MSHRNRPENDLTNDFANDRPATSNKWPVWLIVILAALGFLFCGSGPQAQGQEVDDGWLKTLEPAVKKAAISGKPIFVKFEAEWCGPCKLLDKEFKKPAFKQIKDAVILVRINIDQQAEVADGFDVQSIPTVLLLDSNLEIVEQKVGMAELEKWSKWLENAVEGTEFEMPDVLVSNEPPTRTEIKELIKQLGARDAAMRQITMERLIAFPSKTRGPLIESLSAKGKLSQKISVLEVLDRWDAPVDGLDPWVKESFTDARLESLEKWKATPIEELQTVLAELSKEDLNQAESDLESLLKARSLRAGLARMTRYGPKFLPQVYERLKSATTDDEVTRLTALRYWLTASNELRLGWAAGLVELASTDQTSKRNAAAALVDRATLLDQSLLLELFADSDPLVRELSLKGLNQVGAKETDAILAGLLNDPDPNVRVAVLKQFADSESTSMVPAVSKYLETEKDDALIVQALKYLKSVSESVSSADRVLAPVLRFTEHESWQVRAEVAETLGKIDADELSEEMIIQRGDAVTKLLEDEDGFVVSRALTSLPNKKTKSQIANLAEVAMRKPAIASEISESLTAYQYSSNRVDVSPHFKKFMKQDAVELRLAGINGMASHYAEDLTDDELAKLLQDENDDVRVQALKAFSRHLDSYRDYEELTNRRNSGFNEPAPRSSGILGIFGFGKSKKPKAEKDVDENDADAPPTPREKPEIKLPKKKGEAWIVKWRQGKVRTKIDKATDLISTLADAESPEERFFANYNLVLLGDDEKIPVLFELAEGDPNFEIGLQNILKWLPFEKRMEVFESLLPRVKTEDQMESLLSRLVEVRNPEAARLIWNTLSNESSQPTEVFEHLLKAYFADSVSRHSPPSESRIDKNLIQHAIKATQPFIDSKEEKQQITALLVLNNLDPKLAKEKSDTIFKTSKSIKVRDLAFRIVLKKVKDRAVAFLDTEEAWQYKIALRYLALGEDSLNRSDNMEEYAYLGSRTYYYGGNNDDVKVKVPKPPKGMTLKHLKPEGFELDESTNAIATYYRALFDKETKLKPLLDYFKKNQSEEIAKLVYEAIASVNADEKIPIVEKIYLKHGEHDTYFSANLYWTIRVMDGRNAIKLRKKIRDEVGMDDLKNY